MTESKRERRRYTPRYLDGAELKRRREATGMTQAALAELASAPQTRITQNRITHWERGDDGCEIEVICLLAEALPDCTAIDLMHEDGVKAFTRLAEAIQSAPGAATAA
jgi:transcriptional regulator with XRE-family HTH domain